MSMILEKISNFLSQNRRAIFLIGVFLFMVFGLVEAGYASELDAGATPTKSDTASGIVQGLGLILKIVAALLGVLTAFVTLFISPDWTGGQIFGMQVHLKQIWILVSNVVYFVFAMILIAIAFMNIIGKDGDKWALKQALPRFIVGILIVPFSWFFVQFVLSLSAILTVGVLTLPYDTFKEYDFYEKLKNSSNGQNEICIHPVVNLGSEKNEGDTKETQTCRQKGTIFDIIDNGDNVFGIISIYTYGILTPDELDTLANDVLAANTGSISTLVDLIGKMIFDLIFVIVYFILLAALFLALFVRGVWLWMYMMLSPAFGLLYFFQKGTEGVGGEAKFSIKEFVSLALVPVYVSAALSFGLLFIFVAGHGMDQTGDNKSVQIDSSVEGEETITLLGNSKFTITGFQGKGPKGIISGVGGALGTIIMELFGLVILWIAVMAALKQSDVTQKIAQPIEQFGSSVGKLVASSPMYAPIIPGGSGGNLSAMSLPTISGQLESSMRSSAVDKGQKFFNDVAPGLSGQGTELTSLSEKAVGQLKQANGSHKDIAKVVRNLIDGRKSDLLASNTSFHKRLKEAALAAGVDKKRVDSWNLSNKDGVVRAIAELDHKLDSKGLSIIAGTHSNFESMTGAKYDRDIVGKADAGTGSTTTDSGIHDLGGDKGHEVKISYDGGSSRFVIEKDGTVGTDGIDDLVHGIEEGLSEKRVTQIFDKLNDTEQTRVATALKGKLDGFEFEFKDGKAIIKKKAASS